MPTGYTAGVRDGTITSFREYALQCARAFGACITLRDEPLSAEIPELEPTPYYKEKLIAVSEELTRWEQMTEADRQAEWERYAERQRRFMQERMAEYEVGRARYTAMLEKVQEFKPPTPAHEEYVTFLRTQLEESIRWDCPDDYKCEYYQVVPCEEWVNDQRESLQRDVNYYAEKDYDECRRVFMRNKWIKDLKEALEAYDATLLCATANQYG